MNSKQFGLSCGFEVAETIGACDYKEPQLVMYEWHSSDTRIKPITDDISPTISAGMGAGGQI